MSLEDVIKRIALKDMDEIEETVKFRAVAPVLEELGWDVLDRKCKVGEEEVEFEESFDSESSRKADIALKSDGKYLAVVEVKRSSKGLEQVDLRQVVTYAHQLGVQIIALTNGKQWWMYSTSIPGLQFKDRRFLNLDVISSDPAQSAEELKKYLSRARLRNGAAVKSAEKKLKEQHAKQALIASIKKVWKSAYDEMVKDPDLLPDVITYVFDALKKNKKASRNQVEQAIQELNEISETLPKQQPTFKPRTQNPKEVNENKARMPKMVSFTLWGKTYPAKAYTEIALTVFDLLWKRHSSDFNKIEHWSLHIWLSRPHISNDKSKLGAKKIVPITDSGYYLDKDINPEFFAQLACDALEIFGYNSKDLKVLTNDGKTYLAKELVDVIHQSNCKYSATIFGKTYLFYNRISILFCLSEILWEVHNTKFKHLFDQPWDNKGNMILSSDKNRFDKSYEIANSGYFVTRGLRQAYVDKACDYILGMMNFSPASLQTHDRKSTKP